MALKGDKSVLFFWSVLELIGQRVDVLVYEPEQNPLVGRGIEIAQTDGPAGTGFLAS